MLGRFEERLSQVPRWSLMRLIQRQSVADHSYRVALIAPRFAIRYYGVAEDDYEYLYACTRIALLHDQYEAFSGDMATMVKDLIDESKLAERYKHQVKEDLSEWANDYESAFKAVKLADKYEALVFLATEIGMGNRSVYDAYIYMQGKIEPLYTDQKMAFEIQDSLGQFMKPTPVLDLR